MMNEWRPIETMPKDGSYFLVGNCGGAWVATYQPKAQSGYTFEDPLSSRMLNHDHIEQDCRFKKATHWQPLPPPPKERQ